MGIDDAKAKTETARPIIPPMQENLSEYFDISTPKGRDTTRRQHRCHAHRQTVKGKMISLWLVAGHY